jgi:electron transfer flavoprotein beta subunit
MGDLHIVVCVKMVPDTAQVRVDPVTNTLIREGIPFITNPFDDHAVETALSVKDRYGAHVSVVSMGPGPAETVLRKAISRGADAGYLLSDKAFGGSDTLATSRILAAAVRRLADIRPVDLVVCGRQTIDGDTGQVGPGIATRLGYAQVTLVDRVEEVDAALRRLVVRAKLDDRHEVIEAAMPAVITVVREINRPRYPTVAGRLTAEDAPITIWSNDMLKLPPSSIGLAGSPTWVKRIFAPPAKAGVMVDGRGEHEKEAIGRIIEKLEEWKVGPAGGRAGSVSAVTTEK